ncbi:MAG: VCBS repeat-containing protein [Deltaproteobacteria bacterium]|nr:VCBS repeat-containing protein [Deltaproteobacteria bacterium]
MRRATFNINMTIAILMITVLFAPMAYGKTPARVLILPLNIHSDRDLSFLKEGVREMLSTRLTAAGEVMPIDKNTTDKMLQNINKPVDESSAYALGAQAEADYVVFGSMTILGNSISTDVRFLDVKGKKPAVAFSQFGKEQSEVLFHIDRFAAEVNEKVFGRKTYTYRKTVTADEQVRRRKHPDSLITSDQLIITEKEAATNLWRSRRYKTVINGIAAGDVDGDGRTEVAFVDKENLMIHRLVEGRFEKVGQLKAGTGTVYLTVDVADINRNGISEIFVTSVSLNEAKMNSFVAEWSGSGFKKIVDRQNWYYRVIRTPDRGNILVGQKRGIEDLFWKSVYELEWKQGKYRPVEKLPLPKGQKVFGFTYGDIMKDGRQLVISFDGGDYLRVLDPNGREIWISGERFGGTTTYLDHTNVFDTSPDSKNRYYLPQRIHVVDIDSDGKNEVITVKNTEAFSRTVAARLRVFRSGHIECLSWDTMGLRQKWKTRKNSGYISDSIIADIDNDGKNELVFSLVSKPSPIIGGTRSYIVAMKVERQQTANQGAK